MQAYLLFIAFALSVAPAPGARPTFEDPLESGPSVSVEDGWVPHNVILIVVDDVGVDMIGVYDSYNGGGSESYPNSTPNIDQLAYDGLLFRNAWTAPTCSATRAQILTGQHGHRNGISAPIGPVPNKALGLQHSLQTLPGALRQLSLVPPYQTAVAGKWHLAGSDQHPPPESARFHPLGPAGNPWFHSYAGAMEAKFKSPESYNSWTKTIGGMSVVPGACSSAGLKYCETAVFEYATVDTASDAIAMIGSLPQPFFLYVSFNAVHTPIEAPASELPDPPAGCNIVKPGYSDCINNRYPDAPHDTRCMVEWLDYEIGRVLCTVESTPLGDTTIVFMGDNGTSGNYPSTATNATVSPFNPQHAKASVYQGGINVPFIVKSPLIQATPALEDTGALVTATDLFATVLNLATGAAPAPGPLQDSISFVPVLTDPLSSPRTYAFAERFKDNFVPEPVVGGPPPGFTPVFHHRAIRDVEGYKLIQLYETDHSCTWCVEERFYQVETDPYEQTNLIEQALDAEDRLNQKYVALRAQLDADYLPLWPATAGACPGTNYCQAGTSKEGCQALVYAAGVPSATATSGFCLVAAGAPEAKDGLFFFGDTGRQANPWGSSTSFQCVIPPVFRTGVIPGAGTSGECDGAFVQDMNALWCPSCPKPAKNPGAGALVQAQLWYRDPQNTSNQTTSLSDAVEFAVGP